MKSLIALPLVLAPVAAAGAHMPGGAGIPQASADSVSSAQAASAFVYRDSLAGYTFTPPPSWSDEVRAMPMDAARLQRFPDAVSGVDFLYTGAGDERRLLSLVVTRHATPKSAKKPLEGTRPIATHGDFAVVALVPPAGQGDVPRGFRARLLTAQQVYAALRWPADQSGQPIDE